MIKSILFFVIGAGAMYLYLNPGDVAGMKDVGLNAINSVATTVLEATDLFQVVHTLASLK